LSGAGDVAGQDARQVVGFLLGAAHPDQRRADHVEGEQAVRQAAVVEFLGEQPLLDRAASLAAVLARPGDAEPAVRAQPAQEPAAVLPRLHRVGDVLRPGRRDQPGFQSVQVGAQLGEKLELRRVQRPVHWHLL
jgi:hypothetical protein